MLTPGPSEPVSDDASARPRRRFRRSVLLLGGGAAGVVVGIALSAAFSSAADAAPLPTPSVPSASTLGVVTGDAGAIAHPGPSAVAASPKVGSDKTGAVAEPALKTVRGTTDGLNTTAGQLAGPLVHTVQTSLPSASLDELTGDPVIATSTHTHLTGAPTTGTVTLSGGSLSVAPAVHGDASNPITPRRPPRSPDPSQVPPSSGTESVGSSSPGQGGSPWGALPPTTVLLLPLLLGALLLAWEKTPLLIFDLRYSPPG